MVDRPTDVRPGESLDIGPLGDWLAANVAGLAGEISAKQFPSGHSNLTYMLDIDGRQVVLRRPPHGAQKIATGHDMHREYTILSHLEPVFDAIASPIAYCDEADVIGAPFYLMERVQGVILRGAHPSVDGLDAAAMGRLSNAFVDTLARIHAIDLDAAGLTDFGNPDGYVDRQISGWTTRYRKSKTDDIPAMDHAGQWLADQHPVSRGPAVIHNDFKYDNLVLDPAQLSHTRAVLDWEMATVGDPCMDLGTSLAYWVEADDPEAIKSLGLGPTTLPGNLDRQGVVERYADATGRAVDDIVFYYVYGLYKVAVIGQQIYARFQAGDTDDPRFGRLIHAVKALAGLAQTAIDTGRIRALGRQ